MTTIKQIAQDPRKALRELEIKLGANPGDLLREMEQLSPPGDESGTHPSYQPAVADEKVPQVQVDINSTEHEQ